MLDKMDERVAPVVELVITADGYEASEAGSGREENLNCRIFPDLDKNIQHCWHFSERHSYIS